MNKIRAALLIVLYLLLAPFPRLAAHDTLETDRIKTIRSLKKLDDFPLYSMRFYGDYELPDYAARVTLPQNLQCTCFSVKTEQGNQLLARNFDWQDHPALLLYTDPPNRNASVSMVDISYLGYSKKDAPEKNPGGLMQSPLLPFDGMNEHGLAVGMMAVPSADAPVDPTRQTVGSLMIIRLMLDHANDVEGAVAIFNSFNIEFQDGPPLHYFITDRSGSSAVVELVDRRVSVLRNTHQWQVATNFVITGLSPENSRESCWRFKKVWETLEDQVAMPSSSDALSLLKDVSQRNTIWSVVYDTSSLNFLVVMGKKYSRVHEFNLKNP